MNGANVGTPSSYTVSLPPALTIVANFTPEKKKYYLFYHASNGGFISGEREQRVEHGGSGTPVTAVPDEGSVFVEWSDGMATATRTDTNVTEHKNLTAKFTHKTVWDMFKHVKFLFKVRKFIENLGK